MDKLLNLLRLNNYKNIWLSINQVKSYKIHHFNELWQIHQIFFMEENIDESYSHIIHVKVMISPVIRT